VQSNDTCNGVVAFNLQTGNMSLLTNLSNRGDFHGLTVDLSSYQNAYAIVSAWNESNFSILTISLLSGTITSTIQIDDLDVSPSTDKIIDLQYDPSSGKALVVTQHNWLIPAISTIEVIAVDLNQGTTVSVASFPITQFWIYSGSTYDPVQSRLFVVMASDLGFSLVTFNIKKKSITQLINIPYEFVGTVYTPNSQILGNVLNGNGNSLSTFDPSSGNLKFIGDPYATPSCGATTPHGALNAEAGLYYTVCCNDPSGCTNSTLAALDISNNNIVSHVSLPSAQQVVFGMYWIPSQKTIITRVS